MDELFGSEDRRFSAGRRNYPGRVTERGFVLAWFALLLTVLLGFAGFSVDLGNWYLHVQRAQRAADAAALAGDMFLPSQPATAIATARKALQENGMASAEVAGASITQDAVKPAQLNVTVHTTAKNAFIPLIGAPATNTFARSASAEHLSALQINSGQNGLGGPEQPDANGRWLSTAGATNNYWLGIAGEGTNKNEGDRISTRPCWVNNPAVGSSKGLFWPTNCTGTGINLEQAANPEDKYNYDVRLTATNALGSSAWLIIQAYDAEFDDNPTLTGTTRCRNGTDIRCPGDELYGYPSNPVATVNVNEPWTGYGLYTSAKSNTRVAGSVCRDQYNAFPPRNLRGTTTYVWPSWQEVCRVPIDPRINQTVSLRVWTSNGSVGTNHFMLRASYASGPGAGFVNSSHIALAQANINVSAHRSFGAFSSTIGVAKFKIAQVGSEWAGHTISVELFDAGDVYDSSGNGTTAGVIGLAGDINGPDAALRGRCYYTPPPGGPNGPLALASSGSTLCGFVSDQPHFKAQVVALRWNVPSNYSCTPVGQSNCWLYVYEDFSGVTGTVVDDTTWTMYEPGLPLRIVK